MACIYPLQPGVPSTPVSHESDFRSVKVSMSVSDTPRVALQVSKFVSPKDFPRRTRQSSLSGSADKGLVTSTHAGGNDCHIMLVATYTTFPRPAAMQATLSILQMSRCGGLGNLLRTDIQHSLIIPDT